MNEKALNSIAILQTQLFDGRVVDVLIEQGKIAALQDCQPNPFDSTEHIIDAKGGLLLPGLWDHHMHLLGTAAAQASVHCGPPQVNNEAQLREALQQKAATLTKGEWLRGVGFHESVFDSLNKPWLDDVCPDHPVRIQHRSGMMWILNSQALHQLSISADDTHLPEGVGRDANGDLNGQLYHLDQWLAQRWPQTLPPVLTLSQQLASYGVVGITDTGVNNTRDTQQLLQNLQQRQQLLQKVLLMGNKDLSINFTPPAQSCNSVRVGPLKLYLREVDLPELDQLVKRIQAAHQCLRTVAIHCVTLAELYFALAAIEEAGVLAGDRIEHASIADDYALEKIQQLQLTVVSQPHFIAERGVHYLQDVAADEVPWLYRANSFLKHNIPFAAGSDAPYGHVNPWQAMAAAVSRRNAHGQVMGAQECLTPEQAIALYTGDPLKPGSGVQSLRVGQTADLCLLDCDWQQLRDDFDARHVRTTLCDGRIVYLSGC